MASGNSLMIRALMQSKEVSGIIGKGGEIVKQFRKDSGAWINISQGTKGVSTDRIVSITGSIDSIVTAFNLICDRVEEIQKDSGHQGGRSRSGGQSDSITLQLIIPSSQCGSIIGKGGAKVKEINEESDATVQVKNMLPDSTDKIVLVTGSSETVPVCIGLMCKILIETPPKGVNIPYNPEGASDGGAGPAFGQGPGPIRNNTYHDERSNWMQPRDQFRGLLENRISGPGSRDRRTGYERPADLRDVIRRGDRFDGPRDRFGGNPAASRSGLLGDGALSEGLGGGGGGGDNPLVGLLRGLSALTGTSPQASIQALTSLVSEQLRGGGSLAGLERELGGGLGGGRGIGGPRPLGPGPGGSGGLLGRGLGGDRGPLGGSRFGGGGNGGGREGGNGGGDQQEVTQVIKVPNEKIGSIIGRGGTKIAEVRQMTGANITVSKFQEGEDAAKQERTITIEGNSDQVALAKYIINNR